MDKKDKTYNFQALKNDLPNHSAPDSIWDGISDSLDADVPLDFHLLKDELPQHGPKDEIWDKISEDLVISESKYVFDDHKNDLPKYSPSDNLWDKISDDLDLPAPIHSFKELKNQLPSYTSKSKTWERISDELDHPAPVYSFKDTKENLPIYTPSASLWDKIENDIEIKSRIDQLPKHKPADHVWESLENELEEVKVGVRKLRLAMAMAASFLVLVFAVQFIQCDQDQASEVIMVAETESVKTEWSDDEDMELLKEMCKDYMAVCEQPNFKKLQNELGELNAHKEELLNMVTEFDDETSYGPMLARIETQKTELMKQMIELI